ncbi:hypothetical protein ACLKA7_001792 [Drosophila subpalustris]
MQTSNSYAQVLKVVHSGAAIQEFKNKVSGIRRTAAGEILLRMTKASDECTGKLQKAIQEAIGKQAEVKAIADKVTLEIRDIAEWTTSEEVLEAVFKAIDCDLSSEAAPKLRPAYQGTQTATLILPRDIADQILKLGKMRIGWAVCRLRAKVEPRRCFKCLNFGHIASRCRSKYDATKLCFNCGGENHTAKDCSSISACIICQRYGEKNTAHGTLTQDLLAKIVEERNIDVAILSDTYTAKHDGTWHQSNDGGAAIWSCGQNPVQLTHRLQHRWFEQSRGQQPARHVGYKVSTLNRAILLANVQTISATGDANSCAQKIADCIKTACEASMAKRYSGGSRRNPVPWWNGEISKARAECCAAKRRLQRPRGRSSFESNLMEFRTKRKILRNAITDSKKRCFQELCVAADAEPFGATYKMVMGKLNKQPMPTCEKTLDTIVRHLFPQQPPLCALVHLPGTTNSVVQTTASEVLDIAANIKPGKAPGPDGIPNSVLKTIIAAHPNVFADMFNSCSAAVDDIIVWLTNHGLCLAEQKTEAVLISSRKKPQNPAIRIGATTIVTKPAIKYLGLMIDHRLKFKDHLQFASIKAAHATNAISRIMANTRGPRQQSRKPIAGVVTSILLYGSKVWAPAMSVPTYSRDCKAVYRRCALRVACAFRTVSEVAALVVAGMIPLDLLAAERSSGISVNRVQREDTIMQWQTRWLHSVNGSWTRRLIKDIRPWIQRRHGHVDFYICQLLTGHGCFRAYLYRFKHADSPYCDHCRGGVVEDAEHAFFEAAQDLLSQTVRENAIDIAILCEHYRAKQDGSWLQNHSIGAAIWSCGNPASQLKEQTRQPSFISWAQETLDDDALLIMMDTMHIQASDDADVYANNTALAIQNACNASMLQKRKGGNYRKPVHWWNADIADARKQCLVARRRQQRSRGRPNFLQLLDVYREKRAILKRTIKRSKALCWDNLCAEADEKPFGTAYKIVMGKLARRPMPTDPEQLLDIVTTLFPEHPAANLMADTSQTTPRYTGTAEVLQAAANIKVNKAPGPDGVPSKVVKIIAANHPEIFVNLFNACIRQRTVPKRWKLQRLVQRRSNLQKRCDNDEMAGEMESYCKRQLDETYRPGHTAVASDHVAIHCTVGERLPTRISMRNRWKCYRPDSLDTQVFAGMLEDLRGDGNPECMTEQVMSKVLGTETTARDGTGWSFVGWQPGALYASKPQELGVHQRLCSFDYDRPAAERAGEAWTRQPSFISWAQETLDDDALLIMMDTMHIQASDDADVYANNTALAIQNACNASMLQKRKGGNYRKPVHWWNADIADARKQCLVARRRQQRSRGRPNFLQLLDVYREKRAILKRTIKRSKALCWDNLCAEADEKPFGTAYKIVMGKLARRPMPTDPEQLLDIVTTLFPEHPAANLMADTSQTTPRYTGTAEVLQAAANIKVNKAPGPDGVPSKVVKIIAANHPEIFVNLFNACIRQRTVPKRWKLQRLVQRRSNLQKRCDNDEMAGEMESYCKRQLDETYRPGHTAVVMQDEQLAFVRRSALQRTPPDTPQTPQQDEPSPDVAGKELPTTLRCAIEQMGACLDALSTLFGGQRHINTRQGFKAGHVVDADREHGKDTSQRAPQNSWAEVQDRQQSHKRVRADAITVTGVGDCSYADMLRVVKSDPSLKHLSGDVQGVRKTAKGDLLLRLSKKPAHSPEELQEAVGKALGNQAFVKKLSEMSLLEIRELDELVTKEEVLEAVRGATNDLTITIDMIRSLRAMRDGSQIATLNMPDTKAKSLADLGKIRIGWASLDITGSADTMATQMAAQLAVACDGSVARRRPYVRHHVPAYWWNERIASARQACLHARRRYTRSLGRQTFLERQLEYKTARRILKNEIRKSKRECFLELCDSAEYDPWGKAYKTVVKRINAGNQTAPTEALEVKRIVETLFPSSPIIRNFNAATTSTDSIMLITADEILAASRSLKPNKAPGPDGIRNRALRLQILESHHRQLSQIQTQIENAHSIDNERANQEEMYIAAKVKILSLIQDKRNVHAHSGAESSFFNSSLIHGSGHNNRLPKLKLPNFDGKYANYKRFNTSFNNLIHNDPQIPTIDKFNYLLDCLSGPELEMKRPEASSLQSLIDNATAIRGSLLSIGSAEEIMNSIMIHIVLSKVDTESKSNYDERQNLEKLPTWDDFCKILNRRCQFLESQQADQSEQRHSNVRSKNASNAKSFVNIAEECLQCKSSAHYTGSCKAFNELPLQQRLNTIKNSYACFNCLRKAHRVKDCQSKSRCKVCQSTHHTLLHKYVQASVSSGPQSGSTINQPSVSTSLVAHSSSTAVLPSALVRALLDSCSEVSFITEETVKRLQLKRSRVNQEVSGISESKQKVSFTTFATLKSRLSDFTWSSTFSVVNRISAKQPQQTFQLSEWNLPSGIELADPHFYESNKIQTNN